MSISNHVKGLIIQILQDNYFSFHEEIDAFAMSISGEVSPGSSVRLKIHNLVMSIPEQWSEELIKRTFQKAYERYTSHSISTAKKKIVEFQLNNLVKMIQRTMNVTIQGDGSLMPITPAHSNIPQQKDYIERKLQEYGFTTILNDYKEANETYQNNRRGPIGQLRVAYEGLIKELVIRLQGTPNNVNNNLSSLVNNGILKATPLNHPDPNLEFNFSHKLYGLLSHYGNHPNDADEDIIFSLFLEATTWIYLLLKRYETKLNSSP